MCTQRIVWLPATKVTMHTRCTKRLSSMQLLVIQLQMYV